MALSDTLLGAEAVAHASTWIADWTGPSIQAFELLLTWCMSGLLSSLLACFGLPAPRGCLFKV